MTSPGNWKTKAAVVAAATAFAALPNGVAAQADSENTFACDPGFYQVISGQLAELEPGTGLYDLIGNDHSNYNAMGYRNADGYLYGMAGKELQRIDARGQLTNLGKLPIMSGPYTGDFGDDGLLHISRGGGDWYAVDVDTLEVTRIDELSVFKGVADITNIYGKFYGVSSNGILYIYDPVARTVTPGGTVEGLPTTRKAYGAAWSTAGGNLYVGRNSGEIFQIVGYSTGTPVATQVGNAPPTHSNDGASCALAPVPPGLHDVDGPAPETTPSTPEAQQAADEYEASFPEIEETFADITTYAEPEPEPEQVPEVEVATTDNEPIILTDAGIGQGPSCEVTTDYDREERSILDEDIFPRVDTATVLFDSGFDGDTITDFTLLSGNWYQHGGEFTQLNTCGFDYSAMLTNTYVDSFRWESTFKAVSGANQGGLFFNQSAQDTRSGAMVVDLADGGSVLRWGSYDERGYYAYEGSVPIAAPAPHQLVTVAVEVVQSNVTIFYNGEQVATTTTVNPGGLVGLLTSETDVAFDSAKLTALPIPADAVAPEAAPDTPEVPTDPSAATEPTVDPAPADPAESE